MSQSQTTDTIDKDLLLDFAYGGLAENISNEQREELHIRTAVDQYLEAAIEAGYRIILTGNPGDGKTQHLLYHRLQHSSFYSNPYYSPDENDALSDASDIYYEPDASRESNDVVLDRLQTATAESIPGILAINDGPLHQMLQFDQHEYSFLKAIERQAQHQLVYNGSREVGNEATEIDSQIQEDIETHGIVVIDLSNRNVLTEDTVRSALDHILSAFEINSEEETHISWNLSRLTMSNHERDNGSSSPEIDDVHQNLVRILQSVSRASPTYHYTIRDLFQFLAYVTTGGERSGRPDFDKKWRYYNLAFDPPTGETSPSRIARVLGKEFTVDRLVNPQTDSKLWMLAKKHVDQNEVTEEASAEEAVREEYLDLKRKFLFEPIEEVGDTNDALLESSGDGFAEHLDGSDDEIIYPIIRRINSYFEPEIQSSEKLQIWTSHTYLTKSTDALISKQRLTANNFECRRPRLNNELRSAESLDSEDVTQAIEYLPDHYYFSYVGDDNDQRSTLAVTQALYDALSGLDVGIPYELRDDEEERRLLRFMEEIDAYEPSSPDSGTIKIQDTESNQVMELEISADAYTIQ